MQDRVKMMIAIIVVVMVVIARASDSAYAQTSLGTSFVFQGSLSNNNAVVSGTCDFTFALYNAASGTQRIGPIETRTGVSVTNGMFSVQLDFDESFNGSMRWLETAVRCPGGSGSYIPLAPRQAILNSPYAIYAQRAGLAAGAEGDFRVTNGLIRSSISAGSGDMAGTLQLDNTTSGNSWSIGTRVAEADALAFDFWNAARGTWRYGARLDQESNLTVLGTLSANVVEANQVKVAGWLESERPSDGDNAGALMLTNTTSGNQWVIPIRSQYGDSLDFYFWDATSGTWRRPARLENNGTLLLEQNSPDNVTLLDLSHPDVGMKIHVDPTNHAEIGIYNPLTQTEHWNVIDFDPQSGHVGIGGAASVDDRLTIYGSYTASGTKAATVDAGEYGWRKFYATEAADVRFSDEGVALLADGSARVELDPIYVAAVSPPYVIHLTPYADMLIYVAEVGDEYFLVKAREGNLNGEFAWRVSARRAGYEEFRLEVGDAPGGNAPQEVSP